MRELMRVANLFESWACAHVAFEELSEVWPYLLETRFGNACLELVRPTALNQFSLDDCLLVAMRLRLPVLADGKLPVPVDLRARNPNAASGFLEFRVQTVRASLEDGDAVPFTVDDDPFDDDLGPPYLALYGISMNASWEHIANRQTYQEILSLARKLAPGIALPPTAICIFN